MGRSAGNTNKIMGVFYVILVALLFWKTSYMIPGFTALLPDAFTEVLFWIGYIMLLGGTLIFKGYQIFITNSYVNLWNSVKSVIFFIGGVIGTVIITYIFDALDSIGMIVNDTGSIVWFFYIVVVVVLTTILPTYVNFAEELS